MTDVWGGWADRPLEGGGGGACQTVVWGGGGVTHCWRGGEGGRDILLESGSLKRRAARRRVRLSEKARGAAARPAL